MTFSIYKQLYVISDTRYATRNINWLIISSTFEKSKVNQDKIKGSTKFDIESTVISG